MGLDDPHEIQSKSLATSYITLVYIRSFVICPSRLLAILGPPFSLHLNVSSSDVGKFISNYSYLTTDPYRVYLETSIFYTI
jgi:hypothetical protein